MVITNINFVQSLSKLEYEKHLTNLDKDSQTFRFGCPQTPESIKMFCDRVYSTEQQEYSHIISGLDCTYLDKQNLVDSPIIAHIHIAKCFSDITKTEISLGVTSKFQSRGLGKFLLSNAIQILKADSVPEFRMDCLKRNEKIVRLIRSLGCEVEFRSYASDMTAIVKIP